MLRALCTAYLAKNGEAGSIEWVCNHSRNTQVALFRQAIDVALTYERDYEALAEREGWSLNMGPVFHDQFCLVGPRADPANIKSANSIHAALECIASCRAPFHARVDGSATMAKEQELWNGTAHIPWQGQNADTKSWYATSTLGPAEALYQADLSEAYLLTDRSTLLSETSKGRLANSRVYFEASKPGDHLMNSCYAAVSAYPSPRGPHAQRFVKWLLTRQAQQVVANFGLSRVGAQIFASLEQVLAESKLKGGRPMDHRWISG